MSVNAQKSPQSILLEIGQIRKMERGKLSVIRESSSGPFYKLQARENGRNRTRYVPREQAPAVQEAIEGYQRFEALAEEYARLVIDKTRAQIASSAVKKTRHRPKSSWPRTPKSRG
jgi:hypothetical protein